MPSSQEYRDFLLEQLSEAGDVACRAMMGEFLLYYRGRLVGGIYDNRFLIKPTPSARALMPDAPRERPYAGAKEMLLVEDVENRAFLRQLLSAMYEELPPPKPKKQR